MKMIKCIVIFSQIGYLLSLRDKSLPYVDASRPWPTQNVTNSASNSYPTSSTGVGNNLVAQPYYTAPCKDLTYTLICIFIVPSGSGSISGSIDPVSYTPQLDALYAGSSPTSGYSAGTAFGPTAVAPGGGSGGAVVVSTGSGSNGGSPSPYTLTRNATESIIEDGVTMSQCLDKLQTNSQVYSVRAAWFTQL